MKCGRKPKFRPPVVCMGCGIIFTPKKGTKGKYCSQRCFKQFQCRLSSVVCLFCNKQFFAKPSHKRKFCSFSCSASFHNANRVYQKKIFFCIKCGKDAGRTSSGNKRKLCVDCFALTRIVNKTIKDLILGTNDAQNKYNKVRFNSRWVMEKAGIPKICKKCGYDKHVEVCHIKEINSFSVDTKISVVNNLTNLMYLCPNCHWEFDNSFSQLSEMGSRETHNL